MPRHTLEPPAGRPAPVVSYEHSDVEELKSRERSDTMVAEPVVGDVVGRAEELFSSSEERQADETGLGLGLAGDGVDLTIGVLGLGYVGLPTALGFVEKGHRVLGVDVSERRLSAIADERVDLTGADMARLGVANRSERFVTSADPRCLGEADVVLICVPTPVDSHLVPDHSYVERACADVVSSARPGQVLVLTSTTSVGTTQRLLAEPLEQAGLMVGRDVFVAFSPERIDPGNVAFPQGQVPRVVGGVTDVCGEMAAAVLSRVAGSVHTVSSPEAAEMTKLLENTFRAVNIALANEFADVAGTLALDVTEVLEAAASKPYGFMPFYPGPGVGGHCIPCDPHFLLWQLQSERLGAPVISEAMQAIAQRPQRIVARVVEELVKARTLPHGARLLVVGVAYKPGVEDVRETPAVEIIERLEAMGVKVSYYDPYVAKLAIFDGKRVLLGEDVLDGAGFDAALIHTLHAGVNLDAVASCPLVIDATYRAQRTLDRAVLV